MSLKQLLDLFRSPDTADDSVDPALAAAGLMFEVVWADHDIGEVEMQAMRAALQQQFNLTPERLEQIIARCRADHERSVGLFSLTRALNEQLDQQQKYRVILALWQIALADQQLDRFEEHMIRRIAELLYVSHNDFIRAKLYVKNQDSEASD